MAAPSTGGRLLGAPPEESTPTPEESAYYDERFAAVQEEKRQALEDPGPTWREWFYYSASKWWIGLGLLILDAWLVAFWLENGVYVGIAPSLAVALYAEFLFARVLWYRPSDDGTGTGRGFHRSWLRPVPYGRWTPEADRVRAGLPALPGEGASRSDEFL